MLENRKPEEIPCPECNTINWDTEKKLYYLIDANLVALIISVIPIINKHLLNDAIFAEINYSLMGSRIYRCKNCEYLKFYSADDLSDMDLKKTIKEFERYFDVKFNLSNNL